MQETLVLLKPDTVKRGLIGKIITIFEENNLEIVEIKKLKMTKKLVAEHYAHIIDKPFYGEIEDFMTSGPIFALILKGENAISRVRELCGATNPLEASKDSIRGMFGICKEENLVHSSDSIESAEIEIQRFFGKQIPAPLMSFSKNQ